MNIFRLAGDVLHVLSIVLLLRKILRNQSCHGISLKTQLLYMVVFITRYLDLIFMFPAHFSSFLSFYNAIMKVLFIGSSAFTVYAMRYKFYKTYDKSHDTFRLEFLLVPCAVLSLIFNHGYRPLELLWTFSIYLEAVAILPQLTMLWRTREIETITKDYIFCLGGYRGMYLLNWVFRIITETGYRQWIVWIAGLVQTGLYADFFYAYYLSWRTGDRFRLPA